ncbi:MAG: glycine betaine ABC transporter substrate-binding protein [Proteobacteria bacterium]|nr:glycine betaine ABC transporter substrate-binding protein [Pseudomonadota bacterium]
MKFSKHLTVLMTVMLAVLFAGNAFAVKKKTVKIAYVEWACATASSNVAKAVIEEKLGYTCELIPVSAAAMYQALSTGDVDAITTAWLPVTHKDYMDKIKTTVVDLGPNLKGAKLGLVVPSYVTIDSVDQINANAKKFKKQIIGIDPGAGLMGMAEKALVTYDMKDMELMEGSGAMMTAMLGNAIKNNEWIVVTGWAPHWKFGRWDLKILKDPKGVFGSEETVNTIVRKGLKEDLPDVNAFLDAFFWTTADIGQIMVWNQDGMDPADSAKKWVKENPDKVAVWLKH